MLVLRRGFRLFFRMTIGAMFCYYLCCLDRILHNGSNNKKGCNKSIGCTMCINLFWKKWCGSSKNRYSEGSCRRFEQCALSIFSNIISHCVRIYLNYRYHRPLLVKSG